MPCIRLLAASRGLEEVNSQSENTTLTPTTVQHLLLFFCEVPSGPRHVSIVGEISTIMGRKWGFPPHLPHNVRAHEALLKGLGSRSWSAGLWVSLLETRQTIANGGAPKFP